MLRSFFQLLIILLISILIGNVAYGMYEEFRIGSYSENDLAFKSTLENEDLSMKNNLDVKSRQEEVNLPNEYKGYLVDAKLEIPKIGLDTYVFKEYENEAMWICPTKYYGPEPNEIGNYCIAAHNYNKVNMFDKIIKLKEGDIIYLSDNKNGKQKYEVYATYKVKPENTMPLSQETRGDTEITLITCSDFSSMRIIVKAVSER